MRRSAAGAVRRWKSDSLCRRSSESVERGARHPTPRKIRTHELTAAPRFALARPRASSASLSPNSDTPDGEIMTKATRKTKPLRTAQARVAAPEIIVRAARSPSTKLPLLRRCQGTDICFSLARTGGAFDQIAVTGTFLPACLHKSCDGSKALPCEVVVVLEFQESIRRST